MVAEPTLGGQWAVERTRPRHRWKASRRRPGHAEGRRSTCQPKTLPGAGCFALLLDAAGQLQVAAAAVWRSHAVLGWTRPAQPSLFAGGTHGARRRRWGADWFRCCRRPPAAAPSVAPAAVASRGRWHRSTGIPAWPAKPRSSACPPSAIEGFPRRCEPRRLWGWRPPRRPAQQPQQGEARAHERAQAKARTQWPPTRREVAPTHTKTAWASASLQVGGSWATVCAVSSARSAPHLASAHPTRNSKSMRQLREGNPRLEHLSQNGLRLELDART